VESTNEQGRNESNSPLLPEAASKQNEAAGNTEINFYLI
jgi:hypothetical protein